MTITYIQYEDIQYEDIQYDDIQYEDMSSCTSCKQVCGQSLQRGRTAGKIAPSATTVGSSKWIASWFTWFKHRRQLLLNAANEPLPWFRFEAMYKRSAEGSPLPFPHTEWNLFNVTMINYSQSHLIMQIDGSESVLGDGLKPVPVDPAVMRCCHRTTYSIGHDTFLLTTGRVNLLHSGEAGCVARRIDNGYVFTLMEWARDVGGDARHAMVKLVFPDGQSHGSVQARYDYSINKRLDGCVAMVFNSAEQAWEANAFITIY